MTMYVVPPIAIASAQLASSTIPEPATGEVAWVSGTTYAPKDVRYRAATHRVYICLNAVTSSTPPENDPANWFDSGATARYAMFDVMRNAPAVLSAPLTVVLTPQQRVDSLALMNMVGVTSATIVMTNAGVEVYRVTRNLNKRITGTWSRYYFSPFSTQANMILFDLPPFANATITITLSSTYGSFSPGTLVLGRKQFAGLVQYTAESDVANYSTVDRDNDGVATFEPTRNIPKTSSSLFIDKSEVPRILDLREDLNAVPAVWAGLDDDTDDYFGALLILGFYRQFTINIAQPTQAVISLQLEEI